MAEVCLLFGLFPDENLRNITQNSVLGMQNAANALQWCFLKGISANVSKISVINFPYLGPYPRFYKKAIYVPKCKYCSWNNIDIYDNSYLNLPLIKHFYIKRKAVAQLEHWVKKSETNKVIVIYALYPPFLSAAINVKNKYPNVKVCVIVPDLPEGMSDNRNILYKYLKSYFYKDTLKQNIKIDYFVYLSKYMNDYFNCHDSKYTVIEGIYDVTNECHDHSFVKKENNNIKTIVYCGSLSKRYGILNLLNAFLLLKDENYRLVICGAGDSSELVNKAATEDYRIDFRGEVSHEKVIELISNATLLVNPRTNEGKYTKYSFPSKTMEFLASGVPTLLYKLDGIPDEYYDYCYSLESYQGIEHLSLKIDEILKKNNDELYEIGKKARNFILNNKSPKVQCLKLIELINK